MSTNRVTFLVDGFNVYHSLKHAMRETDTSELRWLNLWSLFSGYLHLFGREAELEEIFYFSAYAKHLLSRKPDVVNRHRTYVEAISSTGVQVEMARFKEKRRYCHHCGNTAVHHEEKETDVSIAAKIFERLVKDACDTVVIVSGDTDLAPAMRTAKELFAAKQISVAFPFGRTNNELKPLADFHFSMSAGMYEKHQFPDPMELPSGRQLHRPATWGTSSG